MHARKKGNIYIHIYIFFFFWKESSEKLTQHRYIGCPHVLWFMVVLFLVRGRKACIFHLMYYVGFSGSSNGKESTCNVGRKENVCSLQYSCLENSMDRGGLQSTGSQRVEYSWATNSFTFLGLCAHPGSSLAALTIPVMQSSRPTFYR